jgi:PAS domain S-box-containing protein
MARAKVAVKKAPKKIPHERKLQETQKFFRSLLDSIADPIFVKDSKHRWVEGNTEFWKLMGGPKEKFINKSDYEIFSKEEADIFWKRDNEVFKSGKAVVVSQETITPKPGKTILAQTKKTKIKLPDGSLALVGVIRDITEFVKMRDELSRHRDSLQKMVDERTAALLEAKEDLEKKNEELIEINGDLEDFTYIVTHDIRSPLINIQGFSEEISAAAEKLKTLAASNPEIQEILDKDIIESVQYINRAVKSLDGMTNSILEFSRKGKVDIRMEPINTRKIIEDILHRYSHQIRKKNIQIKLGTLPNVVSDYLSFKEVFSNIIDNAVKYISASDDGIIEIKGKYYPAKNHTQFSVKDNGSGIMDEAKSKVFQIMRRATLDKTVPGHGMGMPYAKAVLKKLKGKIWFNSTQDQGTTFYFTIQDV